MNRFRSNVKVKDRTVDESRHKTLHMEYALIALVMITAIIFVLANINAVVGNAENLPGMF